MEAQNNPPPLPAGLTDFPFARSLVYWPPALPWAQAVPLLRRAEELSAHFEPKLCADPAAGAKALCELVAAWVAFFAFDEAERVITLINRDFIEYYDALQALGIGLAAADDIDRAKAVIARASDDNESVLQINREIAFDFGRKGMIAEAQQIYGSGEIGNGKLAMALCSGGLIPEAMQIANGIKDRKRRFHTLSEMALFLFAKEQWPRAEPIIRELIADEEEIAAAHHHKICQFALALATSDAAEEATPLLLKCRERVLRDTTSLDLVHALEAIAAAFAQLGRHSDADETRRLLSGALCDDDAPKALQRARQERPALHHLLAQGRRDSAQEIANQSGQPAPHWAIAVHDAATGNSGAALENHQKALQSMAASAATYEPEDWRREDVALRNRAPSIEFAATLAVGGDFAGALEVAGEIDDIIEPFTQVRCHVELSAREQALLEIAATAEYRIRPDLLDVICGLLTREPSRDWLRHDLARIRSTRGDLTASLNTIEQITEARIRALALIRNARGLPLPPRGTGNYLHPGRPIIPGPHFAFSREQRARALARRLAARHSPSSYDALN